MGWEMYLTIENKNYEQAFDIIYNSFQNFADQYTIIKSRTEFILNGDDEKWPEIMQMSIAVAHHMDWAVPEGEKYIYCLFHVGGKETQLFIKTMKECMDRTGIRYFMEEL